MFKQLKEKEAARRKKLGTKWIESGRNGKAHLTPEEENELIALSHRRKSKRTL